MQKERNPIPKHFAIADALERLGDNHSFFISAQEFLADSSLNDVRKSSFKWPSGVMMSDNIALIYVPQISSGNTEQCLAYAVELQNVIKNLDAENPIGWIVDLEYNRGGNMWPMLAGVGPLLSREGVQGYFRDADGNLIPWIYQQGSAKMAGETMLNISRPYKIKNPRSPIALKVGSQTSSSGEAIVISFIGQPHTRVFGAPTAGLTTANAEFRLADDARLILTSGILVDVNGKGYGKKIIPHVNLENDFFYKINYRIREPVKWIKER